MEGATNVNDMYHSQYEKEAQRLINLKRKGAGLQPLEIIDNLTKISDLKVKELSNFGDVKKYADKVKSQKLETIFSYYGIKNYKYIIQFYGKGYKSVQEFINAWEKNKDQSLEILNPEAAYFSLSYMEIGETKYWFSFIISKAKDLDKTTLENYKIQVIDLVNQERKKYGLNELKIFDVMMDGAQIRAKEQMITSGHTRPDGRDFMSVINEIGFKLKGSYLIGENVAQGQETPKEVVSAWLSSPGHRANILNKDYEYIGVGTYMEDGKIYWAQIFYRGKI